MKKWILKAIVQKAISFLPYSQKINFLLQKYVTKGVELDEVHFAYKFDHLVDHIHFYLEQTGAKSLKEQTCLELGTGWYPIVPMGCFLKGARKIYSVDISPLLSSATFFLCLRAILEREDQFIEYLGNDIKERLQILKNIHAQYDENTPLAKLCGAIHLETIVADARHLDIESSSIDLVTSNNTFEHIYPDVLEGILQELWRVTKKGGLMSHFIDMSDHFAHWDHSINMYNFLQFSEQQWNWIDNSIQPQNRWRFGQYKNLYDHLNIPYIDKKIRAGDQKLLENMHLAANYHAMPLEDVAISHGYLLSKK